MRRRAEQPQTSRISSRIPAAAIPRLLALIAKSTDPGDEPKEQAEGGALFGAAQAAGVDAFAVIREEPGDVGVKTIEREVLKLIAIRKIGLPDGLLGQGRPG